MKRRTVLMAALPVVVAVALLIGGIVERERALGKLRHVAEAQSVAAVQIIAPTPGPAKRPLVLPGTVSAWYQAPIFAQVSGYVHAWYVDYGAAVKAGQLLATIDTPSLDAQYAAARADVHVAEANYHLAVVTAKRWLALAGTVAVSQQEVDVQVAGAEARKAELESAQQNLARYAALEAFKRVVAPFDGVVTARLTDVGSYVNAAGGDLSVRGASTELFTVADVHAVRVFVSVPQDDADQLVPGLTAVIHLPSKPGNLIEAKYLTTARAFSTNTRTAVTELMHVCRCDVSGALRSQGGDDARGGADFPGRRNAGRGRRRQQSSAPARHHARAQSGNDGAGHERARGGRQAREQPARRPPGGRDGAAGHAGAGLCLGADECAWHAGAAASATVGRR
jgi:membrane fusion protein (multidrug efflux system)